MANQFGFLPTGDDLVFNLVPTLVPFFRLRRSVAPSVVEHFSTISVEERDEAQRYGYAPDGVACLVYDGPAPGTDPLVRLWHVPSRRHSFTAHPENLAAAMATGAYRNEGVAAYVFNTRHQPGTVPLYALVDRASNIHLYTTDDAEQDHARAAGAELLGIACWVYPAAEGRAS